MTYVITPDGGCCDYVFDGCDRVVLIRQHHYLLLGGVEYAETTITRDGVGNVTKVSRPSAIAGPDGIAKNGSVVDNTYDAQNRLKTSTDPYFAGTTDVIHTKSRQYDLAGNLTHVIASPPVIYQYDAQNRVKQMTDQEGGITQYTFDAASRLIALTDPVNNTTQYKYDRADRLDQRIDPLLNTTSYDFDAAGRLETVIDRNGRKVKYTYDNADRRTKEEWFATAGSGTPDHTINFGYDNADRLTSVNDVYAGNVYANYTFGYNANSHLTSSAASIANGGSPLNVTLTNDYSSVNNRLFVQDNLGVQGRVDFGYDLSSRLRSLTLKTAGVARAQVDLDYDHLDRLTTVTRSAPGSGFSNLTTTITYDQIVSGLGQSWVANDQVKQIEHKYGTTQLSVFSYGYNVESELTGYIGPEGSLTYAYDETHQLTAVDGARDEDYNFDLNGNRTMAGWFVGANNRLLEDPTYTYQYDNEGNRTRRTHKATGQYEEYFWDHRNRLTKVLVKNSGGTVIAELRNTYDAFDRRVHRWLDPDGALGSAAIDQFFTVYDGEHAWADFNGSGSLTNRYLYGEQVDQIMARLDASNGLDWYTTDNLGSVRAIYSASGSVLDVLTYGAYGQLLDESNPSEGDRFKYAGREWEAAVQLYFNRARWLDPAAGRFISEDPIGFAAGDSNLSRYVGNEPVSVVDPLGLDTGIRSRDPDMMEAARRRREQYLPPVVFVVLWDVDDPDKCETFKEIVNHWKKNGKVHVDIPVRQTDTWKDVAERLDARLRGERRIGQLYILDNGTYYETGFPPDQVKTQQIGFHRLSAEDFELIKHLIRDGALVDLQGCNQGVRELDLFRQKIADITNAEVRGSKNYTTLDSESMEMRPKDYNVNKPMSSYSRTFPKNNAGHHTVPRSTSTRPPINVHKLRPNTGIGIR